MRWLLLKDPAKYKDMMSLTEAGAGASRAAPSMYCTAIYAMGLCRLVKRSLPEEATARNVCAWPYFPGIKCMRPVVRASELDIVVL